MIVLTLFTYGHWPRLLDCYHDVLVFKQVLLNPAKFRGISNWTHYWIFGFRLFPLHWLYLLFIPISSYLVILSYWLPCFHCYYLLSLRLNKGCSSKFSRWLPDIGKKKIMMKRAGQNNWKDVIMLTAIIPHHINSYR